MSAGPGTGAGERVEEIRLPVSMADGVRCAECIERLREAMSVRPGVHSVIVDPRAWTISVSYDPEVLSAHDVERAAQDLGLEIGAALAHAAYRLTGLD